MNLQTKSMVELNETTRHLITNCMIKRFSTKESLDYLKKNKIDISERTFRRYKNKILEIKNSLEDYWLENFQIEKFQKVETKKTVLEQFWKLLNETTKPSEKLAILKAIEKTSDELPTEVYRIDSGDNRVRRILEERNGQNSCLE
ncbi:hypothetical protein OAK01_03365 [Candidatus Nitrosopelagicus sp.]|nr:hypothetical protein [Candidatus Nitrosopelagicus sp.]